MKLTWVTLVMTSSVMFNTFAATIDYQHEFNDSSTGEHNDTLRFAHRFEQGFGLSVEARWGQHGNVKTPNKPFHESVSNGTEVIASYLYNIDKVFSLEPGLSLESTASYNSYRPYLRGQVNLRDDLSVSLTYRPYYKRNSENIGTPKRTSENGYNLTSLIAYNFLENYTLEYELDYQTFDEERVSKLDNKDYALSHDVKLSYQWGKKWRPFVSIGNAPDLKERRNRQTRFRIGVQYTF